ncbi:hypothetical protein HMPREF9419_2316 [Prevotella nigrescens ATCC 33563]|nr:hypothetical protein HMPREF9419_2316 [Prevotella nigrescens ATCC 33563]
MQRKNAIVAFLLNYLYNTVVLVCKLSKDFQTKENDGLLSPSFLF